LAGLGLGFAAFNQLPVSEVLATSSVRVGDGLAAYQGEAIHGPAGGFKRVVEVSGLGAVTIKIKQVQVFQGFVKG